MKNRLLISGIIGAALLTGAAFAQQDLSGQPPLPVPDAIPENIQEEAAQTDLGSSVDDLLANTPEPGVPATPEQPLAAIEPDVDPSSNEPFEGSLPVTEAGEFEELAPLIEEAEPLKITYDQYQTATLRALDKITGRSSDIQVEAGKPVVFGSLNIEMKACYKTPPELPPESAAFLSIKSTQAVQVESLDRAVDADQVSTVSEDNPQLFSGWMFASSPGLSALEHPVYDVWVIKCNAA